MTTLPSGLMLTISLSSKTRLLRKVPTSPREEEDTDLPEDLEEVEEDLEEAEEDPEEAEEDLEEVEEDPEEAEEEAEEEASTGVVSLTETSPEERECSTDTWTTKTVVVMTKSDEGH